MRTPLPILIALALATAAHGAPDAEEAIARDAQRGRAGAPLPRLVHRSALEIGAARERGVIVTLRSMFQGTKLTDDGEAKLESLGRVAAAHPGFGVQVVVHDAQAPALCGWRSR